MIGVSTPTALQMTASLMNIQSLARAYPADLKSAIKKYEPCAGRMLNPIFFSLPAKYFRFCSRECPKDLNNRGSRLCLLASACGLHESVHESPYQQALFVNPTILSVVADVTHSRQHTKT